MHCKTAASSHVALRNGKNIFKTVIQLLKVLCNYIHTSSCSYGHYAFNSLPNISCALQEGSVYKEIIKNYG